MATRAQIDAFLAQPALAVVGVSRNPKKFGSIAFRSLRDAGHEVFPVNPHAESIEGVTCYADLSKLPARPGGVVVVVPPAQTEQVLRDAHAAGIGRVWLQPGAESEAAIRYGEAQGMSVVHGQCILMFARPKAMPHRMHRWVWGLLGKLPR